jgi:hypothetical protein
VALDLDPGAHEHAAAVRGAQIRAIVRLTPIAMTASCLNAVILLATCAAEGALRPWLWAWAALIFAIAAYYARNWLASRRFAPRRTASRRAIRRTVVNGAVFGALWGVVPAFLFPVAPPQVQLLVAVLTSGMMCAGGFVLAPVPLAGSLYVVLVAAGSLYALLPESSPVYLGLTGMLVLYTLVVVVNVNWSAALFVSSRLAEAQVREEVAAKEQAQAHVAHAERMTALGELAAAPT